MQIFFINLKIPFEVYRYILILLLMQYWLFFDNITESAFVSLVTL